MLIKSINKSFLLRLWRHFNYSILFDAEEPQGSTVVYLPDKKVSPILSISLKISLSLTNT